MMEAIEFLSAPAWQRLALTLLHFLWQGAAVMVLVAGVVRLGKLRQGAPRYAAYLAGLLMMAACPVITFLAVDAPFAAQPDAEPPTLAAGPIGPEGTIPGELVKAPSSPGVAPVTIVEGPEVDPAGWAAGQSTGTGGAPTPGETWRDAASRYLLGALPWVTAGWVIGVCALSLRMLLGLTGTYRWRRRLEPLPAFLQRSIVRLNERLGLKRFSRVFVSRLVPEPTALGCLRPMVLLPASLLTGLPPEMLEAVIAHELAHIRRLDLWVSLLQRVMETLLFYHPAVWWLSRRLRAEREVCCDELAANAIGNRLTYASALERAYRAGLGRAEPALAAGLGAHKMSVLTRVRHVLGLASSPGRSRWWVAGAITIATILVLAVAIPLACKRDQATEPAETDAAATELASEPATGPAQVDPLNSPAPPKRRTAAAELCITMLKKNGVWRKDPLNWKILNEEELRREVLAVRSSDQPEELAVPNMAATCMGMLKPGAWATAPKGESDTVEAAGIGALGKTQDAVVRAIILVGLASSRTEAARDVVVAATQDPHPGVRKAACFLIERCTRGAFGPIGVIHIGSPERDVKIAGNRIRQAYVKDKRFGRRSAARPTTQPATQPVRKMQAGPWGKPFKGVAARVVLDRPAFRLGGPAAVTFELKKAAKDAKLPKTVSLSGLGLNGPGGWGSMYRGKDETSNLKDAGLGEVFFRTRVDLHDFGFAPWVNRDCEISIDYQMGYEGSRALWAKSAATRVRVAVTDLKELDNYVNGIRIHVQVAKRVRGENLDWLPQRVLLARWLVWMADIPAAELRDNPQDYLRPLEGKDAMVRSRQDAGYLYGRRVALKHLKAGKRGNYVPDKKWKDIPFVLGFQGGYKDTLAAAKPAAPPTTQPATQPAVSSGWSEPVNGLQARLSCGRSKFVVAQPVQVFLELRYVGGPGLRKGAQLFPHVNFTVGRANRRILLTEIKNRLHIAKGATFTRSFVVSDLLEMKVAGKYAIRGGHGNFFVKDVGDWTGTVLSPPLVVDVVAAGSPKAPATQAGARAPSAPGRKYVDGLKTRALLGVMPDGLIRGKRWVWLHDSAKLDARSLLVREEAEGKLLKTSSGAWYVEAPPKAVVPLELSAGPFRGWVQASEAQRVWDVLQRLSKNRAQSDVRVELTCSKTKVASGTELAATLTFTNTSGELQTVYRGEAHVRNAATGAPLANPEPNRSNRQWSEIVREIKPYGTLRLTVKLHPTLSKTDAAGAYRLYFACAVRPGLRDAPRPRPGPVRMVSGSVDVTIAAPPPAERRNEPPGKKSWMALYWETTALLYEGAPRDKVAARFRAITDFGSYPDHEKRAKELASLLDAMAKEDAVFKEPKNVAALPQQRRIRYLVFKLRDVAVIQTTRRGVCDVLAAFRPRDSAAHQLRRIGKPVVPTLIALLDDRRPTRSTTGPMSGMYTLRYGEVALQILQEIGCRKFHSRSNRAVNLHDEKFRRRVIANVRAWWAKNKNRTELEWIRDSVTNDTIENRYRAVRRVLELQGPAAAMKDPVMWIRFDAARILGQKGNKEALGPLVAALKDKEPAVRLSAAQALGKLGDRRAVEPLVEALRRDLAAHVRAAMAEALGRLGDRRALPALAVAAKDKGPKVLQEAALAIVRIENVSPAEGWARPVNGLAASLSCAEVTPGPEPKAVLVFRLRNVSDKPIRILRLGAGVSKRHWGLQLPVEVKINGKTVPYAGPVLKPPAPSARTDYTSLPPGGVDLCRTTMVLKHWKLKDAPNVDVTFIFRNKREKAACGPYDRKSGKWATVGGLWTGQVRSNTVKLTPVNRRAVRAALAKRAPATQPASGPARKPASQPASPRSPAAQAIEAGDAAKLKGLLEAGLDPNAPAVPGYTSLTWAVANHRVECVKVLLAAGADIKRGAGASALAYACCGIGQYAGYPVGPHLEMINVLIGAGADVNSRGGYGQPPLVAVVAGGGITRQRGGMRGPLLRGAPAVESLLAAKADPNLPDADGKTALYWACRRGLLQTAERLIAHGAKVNFQAPHRHDGRFKGLTPLQAAACGGHNAVVKLLIARGAKVDPVDGKHRTPLWHAAVAGWGDTVDLLMAHGADINVVAGGRTPLGLATGWGVRTAELLISRGADLNPRAPGVWTPLQLAALGGHSDMVKLLLARGAKLDVFSACCLGRLAAVKKFLASDPSLVHARTRDMKALDFARRRQRTKIGELLVARGAKVDLLSAAWLGLVDKVAALLDAEGKALDSLKHWETMTQAAVGGRNKVIELLLARGFKLEEHRESLVYAAKHGQRATVELLLAKGADVNAREVAGALHEAATNGDIKMAKLLLARGANVDIEEDREDRRTPLEYALVAGQKEMAKFLIASGAEIPGKGGFLGDIYIPSHNKAMLRCAFELFVDRHKTKRATQSQLDNALWTVVREHEAEYAKTLIDLGANANALGEGRRRLLWFADDRTARLLLAHGAKVDFRSACALGKIGRVKAMLAANPKLAKAADCSPIDIAAGRGRTEVVKLLLARGAKPSPSSLCAALAGFHKEVVAVLLNADADLSNLPSIWLAMNYSQLVSPNVTTPARRKEIVQLIQAHRAKRRTVPSRPATQPTSQLAGNLPLAMAATVMELGRTADLVVLGKVEKIYDGTHRDGGMSYDVRVEKVLKGQWGKQSLHFKSRGRIGYAKYVKAERVLLFLHHGGDQRRELHQLKPVIYVTEGKRPVERKGVRIWPLAAYLKTLASRPLDKGFPWGDKLPGSGLTVAEAMKDNFTFAAICQASEDAGRSSGFHGEGGLLKVSQNFKVVEVLAGKAKAGQRCGIGYRLSHTATLRERPIRKGERIIWIVGRGGVKALADTPAGRKAVLRAVSLVSLAGQSDRILIAGWKEIGRSLKFHGSLKGDWSYGTVELPKTGKQIPLDKDGRWVVFLRETGDRAGVIRLAPAAAKGWFLPFGKPVADEIRRAIPEPSDWAVSRDKRWKVGLRLRWGEIAVGQPVPVEVHIRNISKGPAKTMELRYRGSDRYAWTTFKVTLPDGREVTPVKPPGVVRTLTLVPTLRLEPGQTYIHTVYLDTWPVGDKTAPDGIVKNVFTAAGAYKITCALESLYIRCSSPAVTLKIVQAAPATQPAAKGGSEIVEEISAFVARCVDRGEPVKFSRVFDLIRRVKEVLPRLGDEAKARLIRDLGRMLVHDPRKIKLSPEDMHRGEDPRPVCQGEIVNIFATMGDRRALPWVTRYIRLYGHDLVPGRAAAASALIRKLGGTVPVPIETERKRKAENARRLGNWVETRSLIVRLERESLDNAELSKIIRRLGEIGDRRAVEPVIKVVGGKALHWIVKQDGLGALGRLGGPKAQAVLVEELKRPMPANAKLKDYGEVEAILRGNAAGGLGNCGDESVVKLLEKVAADRGQYLRVREASRGALRKIRTRLWVRAVKDPKDRGTLQDAYQAVGHKRSAKDRLQHAPPIERKGKDRTLDDWFDAVAKMKFRLTADDDNWLLFRSRQLSMYDQMWIQRIERDGRYFHVVAHRAIWQGEYGKNVTFYPVFGVNLGKLPKLAAGEYEATWTIRSYEFTKLDGNGRPVQAEEKATRVTKLAVGFTVASPRKRTTQPATGPASGPKAVSLKDLAASLKKQFGGTWENRREYLDGLIDLKYTSRQEAGNAPYRNALCVIYPWGGDDVGLAKAKAAVSEWSRRPQPIWSNKHWILLGDGGRSLKDPKVTAVTGKLIAALKIVRPVRREGIWVTYKQEQEIRSLIYKSQHTRQKPEALAALKAMDRKLLLAGLAIYLDDKEYAHAPLRFIRRYCSRDKDLVPLVGRAIRRHSGKMLLEAVRTAKAMPDKRLLGPLIEHALMDDYGGTRLVVTPMGGEGGSVSVLAEVTQVLHEITKGRSGIKPISASELSSAKDKEQTKREIRAKWRDWWAEEKAKKAAPGPKPATQPAGKSD